MQKNTGTISGNNGIPFAAPNDFDNIPASAFESGFEFLNDFAVASYRTIKPLEVAIDDKNEVIKVFSGSEIDCT